MELGSDTHVGCRGEALARCRVLGRCERGVEQGDTALPYGGCDFWAVRHVAQVAVHVDEAIAPAGGASSPEGFAFPRTSDGASARPPRAQQLSTITGADQILVMDAGRIVGRGRHDELLQSCPLYARMWREHQGAAEVLTDKNVEDWAAIRPEEAR